MYVFSKKIWRFKENYLCLQSDIKIISQKQYITNKNQIKTKWKRVENLTTEEVL